MYVCVYKYMCVYVCVYIYIYVCVCVFVCVLYIHVYRHAVSDIYRKLLTFGPVFTRERHPRRTSNPRHRGRRATNGPAEP